VVTICTAQWLLYVPHSGHYVYRTVVTICTTSLTFKNYTFCPHSVFMCFVRIWEQTAIISLYNINWLVFITKTKCVYCAVRAGSVVTVVTICTTSLTFTILRSAHTVYLCVLCGWAGHVARIGERRGVYRVLVGKPEGKRPLGRPRLRWEDNIKMHLQEVGCAGMDWIVLAQDRNSWRALVNALMNVWAP